jgi:hypothetical protein
MAPEERPVISGWWDCGHRVGGGEIHVEFEKARYGTDVAKGNAIKAISNLDVHHES